MSENKEEKKGFWSTLFAPRAKSSCCCLQAGGETKEIKVLGTGCSSCRALYGTVQEAVARLGLNATVEKVEDLQKIMEYNVMLLPALVVDDRVVAKGQKLSVEQVMALIV